MRSLLFVPGDRPERFDKAVATGADAIIVDLEDSVAPDAKPRARTAAREWLSHRAPGPTAVLVRINALDLGMHGDDMAVAAAGADGVMLPKCRNGTQLAEADALLRVAEAEAGMSDGHLSILPIVTETAAATLQTASYAGSSARLLAMTWGAEDLSTDIGATRRRDDRGAYTDVFRFARTQTLLGAISAGVAPIDTVYPDISDRMGFAAECATAAADGFTGKMAIHPSQVAPINDAFTPSPASLELAERIVAAFHAAGDPGVMQLDGQMLDRPHLRAAQALLARAARYS